MAVRSPAFWVLAGTFFVCGASTNGLIGTHLIAACHDHGISEVRSAQLLALMGIFDIVGTTASGWLSDRYSSRHLLFGYYTLARPVAAVSAVHAAEWRRRARDVRGVLRPRLDCDRAADRQADQPGLRTREHRRRLRLDRREPSAGRVDGRLRSRRHQDGRRRLRAGVLDCRRAVRPGRHGVPDDRPAFIHAGPHG